MTGGKGQITQLRQEKNGSALLYNVRECRRQLLEHVLKRTQNSSGRLSSAAGYEWGQQLGMGGWQLGMGSVYGFSKMLQIPEVASGSGS